MQKVLRGTLLVALFTVGCGGGTADRPDTSAPQIPQPSLATYADSTFRERLNYGGGRTRLQAHKEMLQTIQVCMHRKGWDRFVSFPGLRPESEWTDSTVDATPGFGISFPPPKARGPIDPNLTWSASLDDNAQNTLRIDLFGAGDEATSGCLHESEAAVLSQSSVYDKRVGRLVNSTTLQMRKDERYTLAWASWSDCMTKAGFVHLKDQVAIRELVQKKFMEEFPLATVQIVDGVSVISGLNDTAKLNRFQAYEVSARQSSDTCYEGNVGETLGRLDTAYAQAALQRLATGKQKQTSATLG